MNRSKGATSGFSTLALILLFIATIQCADILITDHGAVGNDNTDDLAAFTAAIDAANSGDVVRVPAGTFLISNSIVIKKSNISLIGAGDSSIIKATTKNSILSISTCTNVELAYLMLEGDNVASQGIVTSGTSQLKIHHLNIRNLPTYVDVFGPMGIYMSTNVNDSHIYNNTFYNIAVGADYGSGIRMAHGSNRNLVEFNTVDLTGRGGIFCSDNSTYNVIRNNVITRSGQKTEGLGIEAWGGCNMTLIENNHVDHWISLDNSHFCAVRNNIVSDPVREMALGLEAVAVTHTVCSLTTKYSTVSSLVSRSLILGAKSTLSSRTTLSIRQSCGVHSSRARVVVFTRTTCTKIRLRTLKRITPSHLIPMTMDMDSGTKMIDLRLEFNTNVRFNANTFWTILEENSMIDNGGYGVQIGGPVDGLEFINNVITGNQASAVSGSPGNQSVWEGNTVANNGNNNVPTTKGISNQRPTSHFAYTVNDLTVTFTDESTDADGHVAEWLWDFNDGLPTNEANPTHTYPAAGNYRVTLLVWDNEGRGARYEEVIQVGQSNATPDSPSPNSPQSNSNPKSPSASITSTGILLDLSQSLIILVVLLKLVM